MGRSMKIRMAVLIAAVLGLTFVVTTEASAKKAGKVDICHFDRDTALFAVINISENAVSAHMSNHGDSSPGVFFADTDGDGFGDPAGATDVCPNSGFVANDDDAFPDDPDENADSDGDGIGDNGDQCPDEAGLPETNGCPPPSASLGSDLVIGKAGEHGHTGNLAMLFGDGAGGFDIDIIGQGVFAQNHQVGVADINKDGNDDVVYTRSGGEAFVALGPFSDGFHNTDFTAVGTFPEIAPNCCNRTGDPHLKDVNNDGNLDIVVNQWAKIAVMLGNGDGTFGSAIQSSLTFVDCRSIAVGDVNADGNLDVIADMAPGAWWLAVHLGNGEGSFANGIVIPNSALAIPNLFIRDADGDGDLDIYTGALNGRLKIFTNDGSANFTKTDIEPGIGQGILLIVDDLNGDETPDAVAGTESNNFTNVRVWLSDGSGGFDAADYGPVGSIPRHGVLADINEDGNADIAMVTGNIFGGNPGSLWTLKGNGDGTFQAPTSPIATYRSNYSIAAGDFD